jgi:hypothetical protein
VTQVLLAVGLVLADLATTVIGVRVAGADIESNTIHAGVVERFGIGAFVVFYVAAAAVLVTALAWLGALIGLIAVMAIVVVNNLYALYRLHTHRRDIAERNGRDSADVDVSPGQRLDELALAVTPAVTSDSRGGSSMVFDD